MSDNPSSALVKTIQSPALARVSNQLSLTDKLLTKPEEPFLIPYRKGNKWGFCDRNKNIVIDYKWDWAWEFYENRAWVNKDNLWGIIDTKGQEFSFYNIGDNDFCPFSDGLCVIHNRKDSPIIINKQGEKYISCDNYSMVRPFSEGLALVRRDKKYGFINKRGEEVIPCQYDDALAFSEGYAAVKKDMKWIYVDQLGQNIIEIYFDYAENFSEGLARVWKDGKSFFVDKSGQKVFYVHNDVIGPFSNGFAFIKNNNTWGYINKKGNLGMSFDYEEVGSFSDGLAYVIAKEKLGYIDCYGKEIIPLKYRYEWRCDFKNGISFVMPSEGPLGIIDKEGVEYWEA